MVFFDQVPLAPPDPILGLTATYNADARTHKVNLGVGLYKAEDLHTPVMECVKLAESALLQTEKSKEYLPIEGDQLFIDKTGELIFGEAFWKKEFSRICGVQSVGGTGALRIGAAFLKKEDNTPLYIPHPTWPNHKGVFQEVGLRVENYPYYAIGRHVLEWERMCAALEAMPRHSTVLFHASCHNPTGFDLSLEQWNAVAELCERRELLPFFDCAYQGFGRGLAEDVEAIRLFAARGIEMLVASSNAKNFSLYGERVGTLFVVTRSKVVAQHVTSRVKQMIRTHYSNPPLHGAKVVAHILSTPDLRARWEEELGQMRQRIIAMRQQLIEKLKGSGDFRFLSDCRGMFCYSGLTAEQVERMIHDYGIYLTPDGRINVCGLNQDNLDYVANAITGLG